MLWQVRAGACVSGVSRQASDTTENQGNLRRNDKVGPRNLRSSEELEVATRTFNTHNWTRAPFNRASFQHAQSLFPTERLRRGSQPASELVLRERDISKISYTGLDGHKHSISHWFEATYTDALLIMKDGEIVAETYANGMSADSFHLLNSVSKSFVGMLAGTLVSDGVIDPTQPIASYVPEFANSAFSETTLQHALDMTAAVKFGEDYANVNDDFWVETSLVGWRPDLLGAQPAETLHEFAVSLNETEQSDGERFHYRTVLTNVIGMVIERAANEPLQSLMERRLWQPLAPENDAAVVVDRSGFPYFGAGMNTSARDLARFGQMLLQDGYYNGKQIVPANWIHDTLEGSDELRLQFAASEYGPSLPGGHYRNQVWADKEKRRLTCIGIYGQTVTADQSTGVVTVKLSTHPEPSNDLVYLETILGLMAISSTL